MDDRQISSGGGSHHATGTMAVVCASLAGIAVGGPLIGMMWFGLVASVTILIVSSPLLFISSPLLITAAFVVGAAMVGFAAAGTMALAGISTFLWVFRSFGGIRFLLEYFAGSGGVSRETLTESGRRVIEEEVKDWSGSSLQKKVQVNPPESKVNRD